MYWWPVNFTKVCDLDDLWEGEMEAYDVGNHEVLVVRLSEKEVAAYQGICPHQTISLAEGTLEDDVLTCRAHLWQFDIRTGRGVNPEDCRLAIYPVKIEDGAVLVSTEGITPETRGV